MGDAFEKLNKKVPKASQQINEAWMKQQIAKGKEFIATANPDKAKGGTAFLEEIKMLSKNGYDIPSKPSADGYWHIRKV
jgi:hypothetical protein